MTGNAAYLFYLHHNHIVVTVQTSSLSSCTLPDSSPLRQSFCRDLDQYTARFSLMVSFRALRFIQATIRIRPDSASCAIAGTCIATSGRMHIVVVLDWLKQRGEQCQLHRRRGLRGYLPGRLQRLENPARRRDPAADGCDARAAARRGVLPGARHALFAGYQAPRPRHGSGRR